ncbi:MAG: phosphotyrosine protein phosphatase [Planctomycetes bacterium]|nr:phosphotyrosine protein phosphatase [Planctomycetota bacterium]
MHMVRVCFVCLGNICRSPTAEGVFQHLVAEANLEDHFEIDSAGTSGWHIGDQADGRSRAEAARRGFELTSRSRRFVRDDFDDFDLVVAMDGENVAELRSFARHDDDRSKIVLLRTFDLEADGEDVPDPYYGGTDGFRNVFDICEAGCRGLLETLRRDHGL